VSDSSCRAWLALGSNLGDRLAALRDAGIRLTALPGLRVLGATQPHETAPLGGLDQPSYLNAMVLVEWQGAPLELLRQCQAIEDAGGRTRDGHWASRSIDIDLVRVDGVLCDLPELTLPHPGLRDREFWATSIAELEANG
jgi:2-amino-4-hydroxy-6-hydroxymethyldihydropteridine diphosphokinase